ncbi:MAG: universal stress protein [Dehalococcoidia bacterium]|nr:universal stress protein [Dehalococcoidia bacterium]
METKKSLLLPLEGSVAPEGPLHVAAAIADLRQVNISVLYVSPEPLPRQKVLRVLGISGDWAEKVEPLNAVGEPAQEILRVAGEIGADSIIMLTRGGTGEPETLQHLTIPVLQDPPCPVFVVRMALDLLSQTGRLRRMRRILVPLDGTAEAAFALKEASGLAKQANARLLMLHVIESNPERGKAPATPSFSDHSPYEMEAWGDEFFRSNFALTPAPQGLEVEIALRFGDPQSEIIQFAAESDCDLVVAAWSGNLSPGRAAVVLRLLHEATCPLLFLLGKRST